MVPVMCSWDEGQTCENAEWVIAFMCDRCEDDNTVDLCDEHYNQWRRVDDKLACPQCRGAISWVAQHMDEATETESIN